MESSSIKSSNAGGDILSGLDQDKWLRRLVAGWTARTSARPD